MPSSDEWRRAKHRMIACAFSFVTGYTDVISVTRWKVFMTMMTGNVVMMGRTVHRDPLIYVAIMTSFFLGAMGYRLAETRWPNRGASMLGLPFGLLMVCWEAVLMADITFPDDRLYAFVAMAYAPTFGLLNAACMAGKLATTTTLATGHLVALANVCAKLLQRQKLSDMEGGKVLMSVVIFMSLLLGAIVGSVMQYFCGGRGTHGALLPVGPVLSLLFWLHDHLAKPQMLVKKMNKKLRTTHKTSGANAAVQSDDISVEDSSIGVSTAASSIASELEGEESGFDVEAGDGAQAKVKRVGAEAAEIAMAAAAP